MRKLFITSLFFIALSSVKAQEIKALVSINSQKVQSTNKQVYKTLQKALTEFINQKKWTNKNYDPKERINCSFNIIVNSQSANEFDASIQVQATRPVYNSNYQTPILNINDKNFKFKYNEFDPLIYNPTTFDSNLVSTITFYVYIILSMDANSFKLNGGQDFLDIAERVALLAQQGGSSGWENQVGKINRFTLVENLRSPRLAEFKNSWYDYHRKGLDVFSSDAKKAKQAVEYSIISLGDLYNRTIGNYLIRIFIDAKAAEIINIFSDGDPSANQEQMVEVLRRISPTNNSKWADIN